MRKYTEEEIIKTAEEEDVRFVKMQFTDIFGLPKTVNIPVSGLERAFAGECVFDGSSIEGFIRQDESDMFLRPDPDTFKVLPFSGREGGSARLICDVYTKDGAPFCGDSRYVLKKAIKEAKEAGFSFRANPELEFFMFRCDDNGQATTEIHELASYFDTAPLDRGENIRKEMMVSLEELDLPLTAAHHETSYGQHEIDFMPQEGLAAADSVALCKMVIKAVARRNGMHATFMPKPKKGVNGSGMHIHMALYDEAGKNIFADDADKRGLSEKAYYFMAGILKHISAMSLVLNPLVNSYKRIVRGYDAPVDISWTAETNRGSLLRVPSFRNERTCIELRSPDPSCNPYLSMALILKAGLEGIKEKLPISCEDRSLGALPGNLGIALEAYKADPFMREVLGEHIYGKYLEAKEKEWENYSSQVSSWEVGEYLNKY